MSDMNLKIFTNSEFGDIRVFEKDGDPWFVGKDVASLLGYSNPSKALIDHVDKEDKLNNESLSSLGQRGGWIINESGLYSLILSSHKPEAKAFKRWVTHEVIPCVRKTGAYMTPETIEKALLNPDTIINLATQIKSLQEKIKNDEPMVMLGSAVESSDTSISVGDMAKILRQNGVKTGQNRLFEWLRTNGYLIKDGDSRNMPTQKSMELGIMEIQEKTVGDCSDGFSMIARTPKITGKGQSYFVNKFLASGAAV